MQEILHKQEQDMSKIDGDIRQNEEILGVIKNAKQDLESHLLDAMKNEYHKKIAMLENEIQSLGSERTAKM